MKIAFVLFSTICLLASCGQRNHLCDTVDSRHWLVTNLGCQHINTYRHDSASGNPNLVIVIHGDAPFNNPGYQYRVARMIAEQNPNTIAVGILRPGYTDPDGNISDGKKGYTTGDNYTPAVINNMAEIIEQLKKTYSPAKTVLIGHSGGSAITGDVIGMKPGLVNDAVLVSCPCDVAKWRQHMARKQMFNPAWYFPIKSISPDEVADKIDKTTNVIVVCGTDDDITPPEMNKAYFDQLQKHGIPSCYINVPKEGHEILMSDLVMACIKGLLAR